MRLVVILLLLTGTSQLPYRNICAENPKGADFEVATSSATKKNGFTKGLTTRCENPQPIRARFLVYRTNAIFSATNPGQVYVSHMVQVEGFEPSIHHRHRILSPACMPVPTHLHILKIRETINFSQS